MKRVISIIFGVALTTTISATTQRSGSEVLLTDLEVLQPQHIGQQVLHNFPEFMDNNYFLLNPYDVSYQVNEEGQLEGTFLAYRYYPGEEGMGTWKERIEVNYSDGIIQGKAVMERAYTTANYWDHDYVCARYEVNEKVVANYFYGECESVTYEHNYYTNYAGSEAMAIEVTEEFPVSVSLEYFKFVAEYEFRREETRPTVNLQRDESIVSNN